MEKLVMYGLVTIGSAIGAWVPSLWHAGYFSAAGIIGGLIGAVAGWWASRLVDNYINY